MRVKLYALLSALLIADGNCHASKIVHDGRNSEYAHYFPGMARAGVSNDVVNATYYGFFCMAKNIAKSPAAASLPASPHHFFESLDDVCKNTPSETPETGATWRKGYKFYELYLAADRFDIPADDWLLKNKH